VLGRARREPIRGAAAQIMFGVDGAETLAHLRLDEFGSAEGGGAASGRDPTILPCPILEVLKEGIGEWRGSRPAHRGEASAAGKRKGRVPSPPALSRRGCRTCSGRRSCRDSSRDAASHGGERLREALRAMIRAAASSGRSRSASNWSNKASTSSGR
jgi:hypothetical protein